MGKTGEYCMISDATFFSGFQYAFLKLQGNQQNSIDSVVLDIAREKQKTFLMDLGGKIKICLLWCPFYSLNKFKPVHKVRTISHIQQNNNTTSLRATGGKGSTDVEIYSFLSAVKAIAAFV